MTRPLPDAIPSAKEVRNLLKRLKTVQVRELAIKSGVPFTTLLKVRDGETQDPRIETVRQLWAHLREAVDKPAPKGEAVAQA